MKNNKKIIFAAVFFVSITLVAFFLYHQRHSPWFFSLTTDLGLNKGGQARSTLVRIRKISNALEVYREENGTYPESPLPEESLSPFEQSYLHETLPARPPFPWPVHPKRRVSELQDVLVPKYVSELPNEDWWGNPLYFDITKDRKHYLIMSLGSDGKPDPDFTSSWDISDTHYDIVLYDAFFVSLPKGLSR